MKKLLFVVVVPILFVHVAFADSTSATTSPITICKKISQPLWKGKYATTKSAGQWLIYDVSVLQILLNRLGYFGPKPDYGFNYDIGYYDTSTVEAVKAYQSDNIPWIKASGRVDQDTLDYINKYELCNGDKRFAKLKLDKIFSIPGISIKYPSADFRPSISIAGVDGVSQKYTTYLDVCNTDEYADKATQKKTLCYKFNKDHQLSGASFVVLVVKKNSDTCMQADPDIKPEAIVGDVWMSGLKYFEFTKTKVDTGQEKRMDIFRIYKNGKCYEMEENIEVSNIGGSEDDDYLINLSDQIKGRMRAMIESAVFTK